MAFTEQKSLPLDRRLAGRILAEKLTEYSGRKDVIVLALPRGGVSVGIGIAGQLRTPLAVILVQKLVVPNQSAAIGAVASGGLRYVNRALTRELGITDEDIETAMHSAAREVLLREGFYNGGRNIPEMHDKVVVLADDGMISGSTMYLACCAVRHAGAREVIVAVPIVSRATSAKLAQVADRVLSVVELQQYEPLNGWYFAQRPTDRQAGTMVNQFIAQSNLDPAAAEDPQQVPVHA